MNQSEHEENTFIWSKEGKRVQTNTIFRGRSRDGGGGCGGLGGRDGTKLAWRRPIRTRKNTFKWSNERKRVQTKPSVLKKYE